MAARKTRKSRLVDFEKDVRCKALSRGVRYFEALAATGKNDAALALAGQIVQFNGDDSVRASLAQSAAKVGNTALAEKLKTSNG
jgi:hypothetical protein